MKHIYHYVKATLKKVFTAKLFFNRAHNYIALPLDLSKDFAIFMTFWKVYDPTINVFTAVPFYLSILFSMGLIGFLDVKFKFAHLEYDIMNQVNPQLTNTDKILEEIKEIKKEIRK